MEGAAAGAGAGGNSGTPVKILSSPARLAREQQQQQQLMSAEEEEEECVKGVTASESSNDQVLDVGGTLGIPANDSSSSSSTTDANANCLAEEVTASP